MSEVIMICGRLCSGKSTYAEQLKNEGGRVLLSVDELMLTVLEAQLGEKHDEYVRRTKDYLLNKSLEILGTGADVILDWGFWKKAERDSVKSFYSENGFEASLHFLDIPVDEWEKRISRRNSQVENGEASAYFVDEGLKEKFLGIFEQPYEDEPDIIVTD
ncbi:MAG: ATP-binding protein [Oscillospiraceae bacterium]|nr:ATP-binding protein [Oscillospiraceae bacterium]